MQKLTIAAWGKTNGSNNVTICNERKDKGAMNLYDP